MMPMIPRREKGARLERFLRRQRGRMTVRVSPIMHFSRLMLSPTVEVRDLKVSPRTMLKEEDWFIFNEELEQKMRNSQQYQISDEGIANVTCICQHLLTCKQW